MTHLVKIKSIEKLTHDVIGLSIEKPAGFTYKLGQAVDISINEPEWKDTLSCFTFTSMVDDDHLEFVIKTYPSRNRLTDKLRSAEVGDELFVYDPFGTIHYKGEGLFIAGGAGITPFLAIMKDLDEKGELGNNKLIFGNKTKDDIIKEDYFNSILGDNFINVLSDDDSAGYEHGYITKELIKKEMGTLKNFYLCGPGPMMEAVQKQLEDLGIAKEKIIIEEA